MQNITGEDGSGRGLVSRRGEGVYAGQLPAAGHGPDKQMGRYDISAPCHYGKAVGRPGYCRETARTPRREECMRACVRPNYSVQYLGNDVRGRLQETDYDADAAQRRVSTR